MKFGDILKELLEEHAISQKNAAKALNIAPSTFGNYVRNIREPDYETLKNIASLFNVTTDYLLGYHKHEKYTHDEARLLQIFRSMDKKSQTIYLEQGIVFLKHGFNNNKEQNL